MKYNSLLIGFGMLALLSAGCGEETQEGTPETYVTPVGVVSNVGFYTDLIYPSIVQYYLHEQNSFTTSCKTNYNAATDTFDATTKNLYCIADIGELDLYFNNLIINFNAPENGCPYVIVKPYYYFGWEPSPEVFATGVGGLGTLERTYNAEGQVSGVDDSEGTYTGPAGSAYSGGFPALGLSASGRVTCSSQFNHSASGGPNCCEGTINVRNVFADGSTSTVVEQIGGSRTNCITGTATDPFESWQRDPTDNSIMSKIYRSGATGINDKSTFASAITRLWRSNLLFANFYNPADPGLDNGAGNYLFPPAAATITYPPGIPDPGVISDRTHKAYPRAIQNYQDPNPYFSPYYEYICADRAWDTKARIRILIRAWDTVAAFTAKVNPYTAPYTNPDPNEPPPFEEYPFHDKSVWMDLLNAYPNLMN